MRLSIMLMLLVCLSAKAQTVQWMSMDQALEAQKTTPKKILIKTYTDWCSNCKVMDKEVFANPKIAQYINEHFYPVSFNAEGEQAVVYKGKTYRNPQYHRNARTAHEFANLLEIKEYPTTIFMDEKGELIKKIPSRLSSKKAEIYLHLFANDDYLTVKTGAQWRAYRRNFQYQLQP